MDWLSKHTELQHLRILLCLEIEEFDRAAASPLPAEADASCSMSCSSFAGHQEGNCNGYYQDCCYNTAAPSTLCLPLPHSLVGAVAPTAVKPPPVGFNVSHPKRQYMPSAKAKALEAKQSVEITY